ncbi:hypothetical protein [Acrocarpospora sp. B8E8]|uniref:hypothetical protein n=1 Tax=Acrocarpospora sp. B8E8 TaxID=3153572 RepID=UPI00325F86CF
MKRGTALGVTLVTGVALLGTACSSQTNPGKPTAASGPVTITVNGMPPATDAFNRAKFDLQPEPQPHTRGAGLRA